MAVLTNKPVRFSRVDRGRARARRNISFRFTEATASSKRSRIPIGIETLLGESGAARERTIMVGDSGWTFEPRAMRE